MRFVIRILTIFSTLAIVSCAQGTAEETKTKENEITNEIPISEAQQTGEELMNNKCMICHKLAPTHDELLAPPMRGVQMNYKSHFETKEEFVEAVVSWASGPDSTKSIMTGAMDQFGLMPYLSYPKADLYKIANYIYDADLPRPSWAGKGGKHGQHGKHENGKALNK